MFKMVSYQLQQLFFIYQLGVTLLALTLNFYLFTLTFVLRIFNCYVYSVYPVIIVIVYCSVFVFV